VRGGPDAVGRSATAAVVRSIFLVILADVLFTAFFYVAGWD
jgi:ABC-type transporter Mla maintaining outer membrane lipid asymmetry permease subunit MlaE